MLSVYGEARGSELSERRLLFNNRNKGNFSLFKRLKILYLRWVEDNMIIWNYELS